MHDLETAQSKLIKTALIWSSEVLQKYTTSARSMYKQSTYPKHNESVKSY